MMGHPRGLAVLFFTEMWERFSYYGMRSLLVLYMIQGLHYDIAKASAWYGMYTGLVYLTPVVGGLLADRYLGQHRSVMLGGALMALGHFAMMFTAEPFFILALALIVLGCGLFKPSVSVQVGGLYAQGDPRRDGAFSLFYMGINVGALLAPLVCGTLGQKLGWHYGFGCAGLGMLLALVIYQRGHKHLQPNDAQPERAQDTGAQPSSDDVSLPAAADDAMAQTLWRHWRELTALLVLAVFGNIAFWATFEQAGTSLTLFAEQSVDLHVPWLGQDVPSSWFQVANPLFIMVLAPLFSMAWVGLKARAIEPSTPAKFVFGLLAVSAGFTVMVHAGGLADQGVKVSPIWLIMTYFLNTCGELCISPVGLSAVTRLAPRAWVSLMMGLWFASQALANAIGGALAGEYAAMSHAQFFWAPVYLSGISALALWVLVRPLRRLVQPKR